MRSGPLKLGDALPRTPAVALAMAWVAAAGTRVAAKAEAQSLLRGTLTLRVASSIWAQEISLMGEGLVERLRRQGVQVERLRFQLGSLHALPEAPPPPPPRKVDLTPALQERLSKIDDPTLRATVEAAGRALLGRAPGPRRR